MKEKTALVTGGSRGIGLGIAKALLETGYRVAINGVRDHEKVRPLLDELSRTGHEVMYCQGNIAQKNDRNKILEQVKHQFGHLNVLVNNAGIAPRERKDILEMTENSYEEVMKTNLQGPFFLTQSVAQLMIDAKSKNPAYEAYIINISSISATVISVNRGEYCLSKAGMSMMTQLFATRLGDFEIPVYEIRPGITETDMTAGVKEKYDKLIEQGLTIQKRWGKPEDVGKAVKSLVSNHFPYSTGQVIMIDGGLTLQRL